MTGLSYVFLSAYSGLAMVVVAIIRNIIFIIDEKKNGKSNKAHGLKNCIRGIRFLYEHLRGDHVCRKNDLLSELLLHRLLT